MTHDHNHDEIDCTIAIEQLYAYLDNELEDEDEKKFEQHLDHCRSCFSRIELETALSKRMKQATAASDDVPESLKHRIQSLIDDF